MKTTWMKILGVCLMFIVLSVSWSLVHFLLAYFYQYFDIELQLWLQQIITSILGILLLFFTGFIVTRFNKKAINRRTAFYQSITDAMQQIATGDFNVSLSKVRGHDNPDDPFGKIVDHINYMAKELGEVENMRQEFISNVSHEIQSPLTSISGFARALKNKELTKKERDHYLTIIETESKRLSSISDNLMKLTYLEADKHGFTLKEYRLDKQLQHIVLACEMQWQEKKIAMELHMEQTWITADEELMNQVWLNLLHNAIKFTEPHGKIEMAIVEKEAEIIITISDTGIGITEEEKLRLFERFYKADKARNRHTSGSGLGLAIVKKVLNLHNATIHVESDDTGTTFSITFTKLAAMERR